MGPWGCLDFIGSTVGRHRRVSSWEQRSNLYSEKMAVVLRGEWTRGVCEKIKVKS